MESKARRVAVCGMLCALSTLFMLIGGAIPYGTYVVPVISGTLLIPVLREYGAKQMLLLWIAVSILSLVLVMDKEMSLMFIMLFGWYPAAKPVIDKFGRIKRLVLKLIIFNAAILMVYTVLIYLLHIPQESEGKVLIILTLLLGNITFFVYDRMLKVVDQVYMKKYRKLLFKS